MTKSDAEKARNSLAGSGFLILNAVSYDNTNTCFEFNGTTLYPNMTDAEAFAAMRQLNRSYKLDLFTWQRGVAVFVMVNTLLEASEMLAAASAQSCRDFQRNAAGTLANFEELGVPAGPLSWFRDAFAHLAANFESIAFNLREHATTAVNSYARRNDTRTAAWDAEYAARPRNTRHGHDFDHENRCRICGTDRVHAINTGVACPAAYPGGVSGDASGDAAPTPTDTHRPAGKNEVEPNA